MPMIEPAPITAKADAIKVATIRQEMSKTKPVLELAGLLGLDVVVLDGNGGS
jgi:hypothetical protein